MLGQYARTERLARPSCTAASTAPQPRLALVVNNPRAEVAAAPLAPTLSDLERKVVLISRGDRKPLGAFGTAVQRIARRAFGVTIARPLADDRLEALRRFAVVLRHGDGIASDAETARFVAAGYDIRLKATIYALCGDRGTARRDAASRLRGLILAAAIWAGILPPFAIALSEYFEDDMLGSLGATLIFATFAPLARFRR